MNMYYTLLNFYLKSSECLPLFFFPGPIPSSSVNLGATCVGHIRGGCSAQGPLPTCSEKRQVGLCPGEDKDRSLRQASPPWKGSLWRGKRLSCQELSWSLRPSSSVWQEQCALPGSQHFLGSRSFLTKAPAWQPTPCLSRCWWDPSPPPKESSLRHQSIALSFIRVSLVLWVELCPSQNMVKS